MFHPNVITRSWLKQLSAFLPTQVIMLINNQITSYVVYIVRFRFEPPFLKWKRSSSTLAFSLCFRNDLLLFTRSSRIRRANVGSHVIIFKSLRFGPFTLKRNPRFFKLKRGRCIFESLLSTYGINDISAHTSDQCLYRSSAGINRSESDSNDIISLCLYRIVVVWTLLFFNIENDF